MGTIGAMPHNKIDDSAKLRRLLDAVLMIEADIELSVLLRHFVEEACALVEARYGALGVLNEARTGLEQFLTVGLSDSDEDLIGARPTGRGVLGLLITEPAPLRLADLAMHPDSYGVPSNHPAMKSFLGVPVRVRNEVYGNLYLTDKVGVAKFSAEDEALAEALAQAAGIAIENNRLHDRVRMLSVSDDRERIARDLHDRIIQRIFAVGLKLQEAARLRDVGQVVTRIEAAIDGLDLTMNEIRTAIYELGTSALPGGLRRGVLEIANELAPVLGARADIFFHGAIDNGVSQRIADNIFAVLREALTNAGKHSSGSRFTVTLSVGDAVTLEVTDNGVGMEDRIHATTSLGLANIRKRAERLDGDFSVKPLETGGTKLVWSVPL